jgi:hypothetical protein
VRAPAQPLGRLFFVTAPVNVTVKCRLVIVEGPHQRVVGPVDQALCHRAPGQAGLRDQPLPR